MDLNLSVETTPAVLEFFNKNHGAGGRFSSGSGGGSNAKSAGAISDAVHPHNIDGPKNPAHDANGKMTTGKSTYRPQDSYPSRKGSTNPAHDEKGHMVPGKKPFYSNTKTTPLTDVPHPANIEKAKNVAHDASGKMVPGAPIQKHGNTVHDASGKMGAGKKSGSPETAAERAHLKFLQETKKSGSNQPTQPGVRPKPGMSEKFLKSLRGKVPGTNASHW